MTMVKKIWELRGELQTAIIDKDEQGFKNIKKTLNSQSLEFEVMQTKIATKYEDLDKEWHNDILDRPKQLEKLKSNVAYLRLCRIDNRKVHPQFGEEESVMHTIWVLRSKFEKLKHYCKTRPQEVEANNQLYEEIMQTIMELVENPTKYFTSHDEHDAMLSIKEDVRLYFAGYNFRYS